MNITVEDRIVHCVYKSVDQIKDLEKIADDYEGKISGRYGMNFPISIIHKSKYNCNSNIIKQILKYTESVESADYVIVYKKGDYQTKMHELQHAKYYLDAKFRQNVKQLWDSLQDKYKSNVIFMLKKMGYPDHVLLDEFQAYYYTEKENFFGKK
jgi:hypothetical protein